MVRLMIEQMRARHVCCLYVVSTLIIGVRERPAPKDGIRASEERLNPCVFLRSCVPQVRKLIVKNLIERWSQAFVALEQSQPPSITQQNVIQQLVNAAEGSCTFLSVFDIIQLRTFCKESIIRSAVVPSEHLEVTCYVHSQELTSDHNEGCVLSRELTIGDQWQGPGVVTELDVPG